MDNDYKTKLEELIIEGEEISKGVKLLSDRGVFASAFPTYELRDNSKFEIWKSNCLRFLDTNFHGDRVIKDFEEALKAAKNKKYRPMIDKLLGILHSCLEYPKVNRPHTDNPQSSQPILMLNVNQQQTQTQNITVNIIFEAIKDELTGSQLKEIQQLINENKEKNSLKDKLIDKLKSFGSDVATNIIANILTNPAIWHLF